MKFINRVADYLTENELDLKHSVIILPSLRAKRYLEMALASKFEQPIFAPRIITIDSWIHDCSTYKIQDKLNTIFDLYRVHLQLDKEEKEPFDEFYSWAATLLNDFEEIDKYLVSPEEVFKNLRDIKGIENWSFDSEEPMSEMQLKFLQFWDELPHYYHGLRKLWKKENTAYSGMAFRQLAENINLAFKDDKAVFVFAGFNALSIAEMSIMKQLKKMGRAHILQNSDSYYTKNKHHEAGHFQRAFSQFLGEKITSFEENDMENLDRRIEFIECNQSLAQVNVASTLLSQLNPNELDDTLLLLADESLAGPMIRNLPLNIQRANITMGLQLKQTSLKLWVDLIFSIQENKTRFNTKAFYHKDIFKLWQHPFFQRLMPVGLISKQRQLEQNVISKNKLFVNPETLTFDDPILTKLFTALSQNWGEDWSTAIDSFKALNSLIYPLLQEEDEFEKAILRSFDKSLVGFKNSLGTTYPMMSLRTFKLVFTQHWGKARIAYEGTPTKGLQIMGLLETRLLDFKRIICLGLNEGKMPPNNPMQTFIPMDLRRYLNLPTTREKQGLFAHHFYRLMHKVEDFTVTYTSGEESLQSNERSRYLQQIELEWVKECDKIDFKKKSYNLDANSLDSKPTIIEKTPEILQKIDDVFSRSLSASALGKFVSCPLDFYYRYVMEYGEQEEVMEDIDHGVFGTIIHHVLEKLYQPFCRRDKEGNEIQGIKNLTAKDVDQMILKFPNLIKAEFMAQYEATEKEILTGKNFLAHEIALTLTKKFLVKEKEFLVNTKEPVFIEALELEFNHKMTVEVHGVEKQVNLKGFVDRIDSVGGKMRIIDYKSGKVTHDKVTMKAEKGSVAESLFQTMSGDGKTYFSQLMIYAYLFTNRFGHVPDEVKIVSFINYPDEPFSLNTKKYPLIDYVEAFPDALQLFLEKIYDANEPFEHDDTVMPEFSYCNYCK